MSNNEEHVEYLLSVVRPLISKPERLYAESKVDERGVLIQLFVDKEDLGRIIGKKGETANALRSLLRVLGVKNNARYNLKVDESTKTSF